MAWTTEQLQKAVAKFDSVSSDIQQKIAEAVAEFCTYDEYLSQVSKRKTAVANTLAGQSLLADSTQSFPETIESGSVVSSTADLAKFGIVITAGGEGERLMLSLKDQGFSDDELKDFTKATWPLPDFHGDNGALQINLSLISSVSKEIGYDIPVVVTTGPEGTTTARVIPEIIKNAKNFGLKNLRVIAQNERLHLTKENQIAWKERDNGIALATNPDETGGPLMKLLEKDSNGVTILDWLKEAGASHIMVLQGTAVYNPTLVEQIASAGVSYDGMGIGISRSSFPESDPYGTFVTVSNGSSAQLKIVEKAVRNSVTETLRDSDGKYLPFNTGFYTFTIDLIEKNPLPDYASPDKVLFEGYTNAEKVGYAATDVIAPARKSGVLTIPETDFAVIKTAEDLPVLSKAAQKFNLSKYC